MTFGEYGECIKNLAIGIAKENKRVLKKDDVIICLSKQITNREIR